MDMSALSHFDSSPDFISHIPLKFSPQNKRKILIATLLGFLHQIISELFGKKIQINDNQDLLESYVMDSKIIQLLIHGIIESGEYTLEGIAFYTHIPFEVIFDAACGIGNQFSITPWAKVVDLYMQVNPDIASVLADKLLEVKNKHPAAVSVLLNEV